ncbi:hypothetical protein J2847_002982 [Azospirillum agricola]|nr:hypothetical protein [Azospirillum agricola]
MVAAINTGLDRGLFSLDAGDNRWGDGEGVYRFDFAGLPAIASVRGAGFGELGESVAVRPTERAAEFVRTANAGFLAGDAFTSGWLERKEGEWPQSTDKPMNASGGICCRSSRGRRSSRRASPRAGRSGCKGPAGTPSQGRGARPFRWRASLRDQYGAARPGGIQHPTVGFPRPGARHVFQDGRGSLSACHHPPTAHPGGFVIGWGVAGMCSSGSRRVPSRKPVTSPCRR